ncbi:MAG TPA: GlsB/YeaQ/YmgE family stress response membrane protein [Planctomycetota bacterium]|nr:GlsB/YeaQ/YmgE family stress response membrane protein [Planctomycetota bacterium]
MNASQIVSFLIVGALAGSLVGGLVTRKKEGFGFVLNLFCGLVGALIGGAIFNLLHINLGLGSIAVSLEDLIAAFAGALILLLLVALMRKSPKRSKKA